MWECIKEEKSRKNCWCFSGNRHSEFFLRWMPRPVLEILCISTKMPSYLTLDQKLILFHYATFLFDHYLWLPNFENSRKTFQYLILSDTGISDCCCDRICLLIHNPITLFFAYGSFTLWWVPFSFLIHLWKSIYFYEVTEILDVFEN